MTHRVNVADELARVAAEMPNVVAVAVPHGRGGAGRSAYRTVTFSELDSDATRLARGLVEMGVVPGERLVLLVPVGVEFVTLVFALLRSGAVGVLLDPGMGRHQFVECLASVEPDGFVAIGRGHVLRVVKRSRFPMARHNVTIGRRWFWGGQTLKSLRRLGTGSTVDLPNTSADDPAAIIFTSGSTGPAKGVLYRHETFATQAREIQQFYGIEAGGVDLACFALFGLFNAAMGMTTVFPDIDFSRPASVDPAKLLGAANHWKVTQAFASPAVWDKVSRHCERSGERIETLTRVLSCGAPVPADVVRRTLACVHPEAKLHTPYGATEALPVASIEAGEVLNETAEKTDEGAGICVGRRFDSIEWKIIRITDEPIRTLAEAEQLPPGEIGELIVCGPQVTREYVAWRAATPHAPNELAKIDDGDSVWHRMGDVGYLDPLGRFWYCGRKSHRAIFEEETLFSIMCEAVINVHPRVRRSALVRLGPAIDDQPALVVELVDGEPLCRNSKLDAPLIADLREIVRRYSHLNGIDHMFRSPKLPVDVRHNAKIDRERLSVWAADELRKRLLN